MYDLELQAYDLGYCIEGESNPIASVRDAQPAAIVQPGFQLPMSIWTAMIACYVIFFGAMAALTSASSFAIFMVAISVLYALMFFGTAAVLANLSGPGSPLRLDRGQTLPTWCGPMSRGAVYSQILVVPIGVALFGIAVAFINAMI